MGVPVQADVMPPVVIEGDVLLQVRGFRGDGPDEREQLVLIQLATGQGVQGDTRIGRSRAREPGGPASRNPVVIDAAHDVGRMNVGAPRVGGVAGTGVLGSVVNGRAWCGVDEDGHERVPSRSRSGLVCRNATCAATPRSVSNGEPYGRSLPTTIGSTPRARIRPSTPCRE